MLELLRRHGVEYILIGAYAIHAHGEPVNTSDIDIVPHRTPENLAALADALAEMNPRIRTGLRNESIPLPVDGRLLARTETSLLLTTDYGRIDLVNAPAGFAQGYEELAGNAELKALGGVEVLVASLKDVLASKMLANRPKDREILRRLRGL